MFCFSLEPNMRVGYNYQQFNQYIITDLKFYCVDVIKICFTAIHQNTSLIQNISFFLSLLYIDFDIYMSENPKTNIV